MAVYGSGLYGAGDYGYTAALTATVQTVYPGRVLLSATGLVPGATVAIYRTVSGSSVRTMVRGGTGTALTEAFLVVDAEMPLGVNVTYTLTVDGNDIVQNPLVVVNIPLAKVALTDAINGNSAEVTVTAWPDKTRGRAASVFAVGGQNIVVTGARNQFSSSIELFTETEAARLNLLTLLSNLTSGIMQIRQGVGYYGVDGYLGVLEDTERRYSQDGSDERRLWTLDVVRTGAWASSFIVVGYTYQDVADTYTGLSYQQVASDYATYLALAQGDFQ